MKDFQKILEKNLEKIKIFSKLQWLLLCVVFTHYSNAQQNVISQLSKNEGISASYDEFVIASTGNFVNNGELFVYNNLVNEGGISYETTTSVFKFKGNIAQQLKGSGTTVFNNALFDNASTKAPFSLEKNITIKGNADFTDGVISYANNGLMIFDDAAQALNVSSESFVTDKVRKVGNDTFVFPIGDNRTTNYVYRKVKMEAPTLATAIVDAQFLWENPGNLYNTNVKPDKIEVIDSQEYWVVDDLNGNSLPELTFYWDASTTPNSILTSDFLERITIARWDGSQWINEEVVNIDAKTSSIRIKPSGDGVFTFALLKVVLPDFFPTLFTGKTQVNGYSGNIDFVVFVGEANGVDANGINPVEFRIADSNQFQFSFDVGLATLNGHNLNNADWSYKLENGLHKFTYIGSGGIFPASGLSKIGVNAIFISPPNSTGEVPLKVTIKADSGGQEFTGNDNDQDVIHYNANAKGGSGSGTGGETIKEPDKGDGKD